MTEPTYTEEELAAAEADLPPEEPDNGVEDNEAEHIVEEDGEEEPNA